MGGIEQLHKKHDSLDGVCSLNILGCGNKQIKKGEGVGDVGCSASSGIFVLLTWWEGAG